MNWKISNLVAGFALLISLGACSGVPASNQQAAPTTSPSSAAKPDAMKQGDAMKKEDGAMKQGDAMKKEDGAMKQGDAMKKEDGAMKKETPTKP